MTMEIPGVMQAIEELKAATAKVEKLVDELYAENERLNAENKDWVRRKGAYFKPNGPQR